MKIAPVSSVAVATAPVAAQNARAQENAPTPGNASVRNEVATQAQANRQGPAQAPTSSSGARAASQPPAATMQELVQASSVPPSVLQRATGDGDGRTGVAALNDGDAAAQAAKLAAKMG